MWLRRLVGAPERIVLTDRQAKKIGGGTISGCVSVVFYKNACKRYRAQVRVDKTGKPSVYYDTHGVRHTQHPRHA